MNKPAFMPYKQALDCMYNLPFLQVNIEVDYIKPAQDSFPEKICCTVTREDM